MAQQFDQSIKDIKDDYFNDINLSFIGLEDQKIVFKIKERDQKNNTEINNTETEEINLNSSLILENYSSCSREYNNESKVLKPIKVIQKDDPNIVKVQETVSTQNFNFKKWLGYG